MLTMLASGLLDALLATLREHPGSVQLVVFALGFAESLVLVSLLVPSTVLFIAIGAAQSASGGAYWPLWLAGAAGAFTGDLLSYFAGRLFKHEIAGLWPLTRYPDLIPRGHAMFERWGPLAIVIGKFLGGLRPFLPVAAGMMDMPWALFAAASLVSCLLWAGAALAPGFGLAVFTG